MKPISFTCPECGSKTTGVLHAIAPPIDRTSAWAAVKQGIRCRVCEFIIPQQLGQRDAHMSDHRAEQEWLLNYRSGSPREFLPPANPPVERDPQPRFKEKSAP